MKKLFLFAIVVLGFTAVSFGQGAITATATAAIKEAFSISAVDQLKFGTFAAVSNGTIAVAPLATTATFTGTGNTSFVGAISSASFDIGGPVSTVFTVTMPTIVTNLVKAGDPTSIMTIAIAGWTSDLTAFSGTTDTDGNSTFNIGATLNFIGDQAPGNYSGTYDVRVNY